MNRNRDVAAIAAGLAGLGLLVFGVVWGTVVFDRFEKAPSDLHRIVDLEGTYTVVDTEFTDRLQGNATVGALLASGALGQLASDPAVAGLLGNPALAGIVQNPSLVAALSDPSALQLLGSEGVAAILGEPAVVSALADPALIAALSNPAQLGAIAASNPELAALLGDPSVLAALMDPVFAGLLSSGALQALLASPELLGLLGDPNVLQVLSNPVVASLLADPSALSLLLDFRMQALIANPAGLPTVEAPVLIHRVRQATDSDAERLFLREQVTTANAATGEELRGFPPTDVQLVVDRKSKVYLEGTEGGRRGHWALPFHISKDEAYPSWIAAARQVFDAVYQDAEVVNGLKTYRYVVSVSDAPMGADDPATGLPLVFDTETVVWVEPATGSGVDATVKDVISAAGPDGAKYLRFANDLEYSDASVAALVDEAAGHKDDIFWYGLVLPWSAGIAGGVILGLALLAAGWLMRTSRS